VKDRRVVSTPTPDSAAPPSLPAVVVYSQDLFFGMRIRTVVRQLGYAVSITKDAPTLLTHVTSEAGQPVLTLVDFNQPVDWDELTPVLRSGVPVVAFGSHTDVDGFRAAKAAGVARVVSNGEFSRSLADLVAKYART
jgi:CheY-like chemotaxis protein